jgi:predicted phosphodiesterase
MRFGVAGDVHGNIHALEAVLGALESAGCEQLLVPGDLVGYGPRPNECVERLREAGATAIAGNHDLMAIGRLPSAGLPGLQRETIEWTRTELDPGTCAYLEGLPATANPEPGVWMAHGGLDDPTRYVRDDTAARAELAALAERAPEAWLLLLGHTHLPLACAARGEQPASPPDRVALDGDSGAWVLNAGSVGQSRERRPHARALVLDTGERSARFLTVDYDVAATRRELRAAGLPQHAYHLAPKRLAGWRRLLPRIG